MIYSFNCVNGTFQFALNTSTGKSQIHCADDNGVTQYPAPTIQAVVMTEQAYPGLPANFDYTILGALYAFSFSVVVALFFIGRSGGAIINIFKPR